MRTCLTVLEFFMRKDRVNEKKNITLRRVANA
jgi:hypothetical protein